MLRVTTSVALVLVPLALEVVGCHGGVRPVEWSEVGSRSNRDEARPEPRSESRPKTQSRQNQDGLQIVARSGREVVQLRPDDVVRIMQRVGFSDDQILELGTDLYNALLLSGAADVYYGKRLEMILAVNNQQIQIQSRSRGTFLYDVPKGRFVIGATPADRGR